MDSTKPRRTVILAAVDRTENANDVLTMTVAHARTIADAELHLLHVVDTGQPHGETMIPIDEALRDARSFLATTSETVKERFPGRVTTHLIAGEPVRSILQLASDVDADLLIVGCHGKNVVTRFILGSVSQAVANKAPCPVLVARTKNRASIPEIEPPCPRCVQVQRKTAGAELWCEQHARRSDKHAHGHLHYELPASFGVGSSLVRPNF